MIFICNSTQPKLGEGGCCAQKETEELHSALQKKLAEIVGVEQEVVSFSNCMRNCTNGISVRIMPQNQLYGNVTSADVSELLESVFILKKPLQRLLIQPTNRFLGF